jgi:hypothetical protein
LAEGVSTLDGAEEAMLGLTAERARFAYRRIFFIACAELFAWGPPV